MLGTELMSSLRVIRALNCLAISPDLPPCSLKQCLSLNLEVPYLARLAVQRAAATFLSTFLALELDTHHHAQLLMWVASNESSGLHT